jgi:small subunit ribosomal protein S16
VAVKIKLKRLGKIRAPYYRIVVADARTKRDGRAIEEIGKYHPKAEPSFIEVDSERAQHWLSVGAQPTDPVRKLFEITGDWQKFKGLPGTEGTLKTAAPKEDRKEIFAAAVKETLGDAAPKGKGRSGAAKDGDSAAKSGKAAAKDSAQSKADKPARGKSDEGAAEAKGAGEAKASAETAGEAKGRGRARGAQAKRGDSGQTAEEAKGGETADAPADADAAAAAQTADSEPASGD